MDKLIKELELKLDWELDGVYVFSNDMLWVQFVYPHEGTEFKYMIRAEYKENFDKWSNCFYDELFTDLEKELDLIILDLKKMIEEKDRILIKSLKENGGVYYEINDNYIENTKWNF